MKIDLSKCKCQEANLLGICIAGEPIPCGAPGAKVVFHRNDGRNAYVMCLPCADHNISNRGGVELVQAQKVQPTIDKLTAEVERLTIVLEDAEQRVKDLQFVCDDNRKQIKRQFAELKRVKDDGADQDNSGIYVRKSLAATPAFGLIGTQWPERRFPYPRKGKS